MPLLLDQEDLAQLFLAIIRQAVMDLLTQSGRATRQEAMRLLREGGGIEAIAIAAARATDPTIDPSQACQSPCPPDQLSADERQARQHQLDAVRWLISDIPQLMLQYAGYPPSAYRRLVEQMCRRLDALPDGQSDSLVAPALAPARPLPRAPSPGASEPGSIGQVTTKVVEQAPSRPRDSHAGRILPEVAARAAVATSRRRSCSWMPGTAALQVLDRLLGQLARERDHRPAAPTAPSVVARSTIAPARRVGQGTVSGVVTRTAPRSIDVSKERRYASA